MCPQNPGQKPWSNIWPKYLACPTCLKNPAANVLNSWAAYAGPEKKLNRSNDKTGPENIFQKKKKMNRSNAKTGPEKKF